MGLSNKLLAKFELLADRDFEVGDMVGRGFADVGYEEFTQIAESKLLSLFTGKVKEITADERRFLFRVLSVDEMVTLLQRKGVTLEMVQLADGREWHVVARRGSTSFVFDRRAIQLQELLVDLMIAVNQQA